MVLHFGAEGSIKDLSYTIKASWSKNYGTYGTTDEEQSTDIINPGEYGLFGEQIQFSSYMGVNRTFSNGLVLGLISAFDVGNLYYDSFGLFVRAAYSFNL